MKEGTDLIYEGITTLDKLVSKIRVQFEGTDLIYEGITTPYYKGLFVPLLTLEGTDLIYEGITTLVTSYH
jgi:hypothetical protein